MTAPMFFLAALFAADEWKYVQYLGGAPGVLVNQKAPDQILAIDAEKLTLHIRNFDSSVKASPKLLLQIPLRSLLAVTYSGFRHDMPSAQAAIGIPRVWPKSTDHLILIEYRLEDGGEAEVLLRVSKKHYKEIVERLQGLLPGRGHSAQPVDREKVRLKRRVDGEIEKLAVGSAA